jgi:hypothetical protein
MDPNAVSAVAAVAAALFAFGAFFVAQVQLKAGWRAARGEATSRQIAELDRVRASRHVVYALGDDYTQWTEFEVQHVESVIRAFDIYGFMDQQQYVPRRLLQAIYATPTVKLWEKCAGYVNHQRALRGEPGHMWEFEQLARRAAVLLHEHPARSGGRTFPPKPDDPHPLIDASV